MSDGALVPDAVRFDLLRLTDLTGDAEGARLFSGELSALAAGAEKPFAVEKGIVEIVSARGVGSLSGLLVAVEGGTSTPSS
jgi:hypothetical protein